ncbi:protein TolA [Bradyrhizobium sp. UFLA03-84]|uniref:cell envelope integrity protein TolA n=1 Tax=Bradyrhizobium sp. UFLA03-84 TaxID=418599 RepID=UPI000BAE241B|nr:cell envelope integrity protein TolA [Bradyrhizobium sp. UFLA03-84]PAY10791.1 protein TolA [Bradyrhizobium sp. UFLA03-84]
MKVKVDKTLAASIVLHVLVIGWGLVSFSTRAYVMPEEESVAVDVISADQLSHVMTGQKDGKKENPKPLVDKVAEAKPVDDTVGKVEEKKPPVVTDTAPAPTPKVEKPEDKKPDPPKKVENKPKEEPKPVEKKPDPVKPDPIAEAIKKEEKKPPPKPVQQAAKPPPEQKPKDRVFDQSKIAALLDKRDPTRAAATGDALNANAALGTAKGKAADNSATWGAMFRQQVERCWTNKPYGGLDDQRPEVAFNIRLKRDGGLEGMPVPDGTPPTPYARAYADSALRAIIQCQPYRLPAAFFDEWKSFTPVFQEKQL